MNPVKRRNFLGWAAAASAIPMTRSIGADPSSSNRWISWRGESRDALCNETWPEKLELTKQWSVPMGDSYSGPLVTESAVFSTETVGKKDESLIAVDRASGETIWKQQWPGAMSVPFFAARNGSWIRATPATDGQHIVVPGMCDTVQCFEVATGKKVWDVDYVKEDGMQLPSFGLVCSPIIDGEDVYIQAGGAIRKLNLKTGETVWSSMRDPGGMNGGSFSSPIIDELHGVRQLIAQTRSTLCGLDLETGDVLWQKDIPSFRGMNILTPTVWKNRLFTSSYGGRSFLLDVMPSGSQWQTKVVWEAKAEAYMSSPLVVGDHLFMHLKNKRFCCMDLSTGKETWRTTPFGDYWSMVSNGQLILALDQVGELLLIKANTSEFELLDRKQVASEPTWAHLAIAGDSIYVRRQRGLDALTWQG